MFRDMRRKRQLLSEEECISILNKGTSGVLALAGENDYPYSLPISYVYDNGRIIFHSAKSGHKIDAIKGNPKVSFCVVDQDHIVPEKYTTYFRSVIAFGEIRILEDDTEKRAAIEKLAMKYAPETTLENLNGEIKKEWAPLCVLVMSIQHMTGKEAIELVRAKKL